MHLVVRIYGTIVENTILTVNCVYTHMDTFCSGLQDGIQFSVQLGWKQLIQEDKKKKTEKTEVRTAHARSWIIITIINILVIMIV